MALQMEQEYINGLLGLVALFGGWWMKAIWDAIKDLKDQIVKLQDTDKTVLDDVRKIEVLVCGQYAKKDDLEQFRSSYTSRVQDVEVLLARHYVTREELTKISETLITQLSRIEDKIDKKADKP